MYFNFACGSHSPGTLGSTVSFGGLVAAETVEGIAAAERKASTQNFANRRIITAPRWHRRDYITSGEWTFCDGPKLFSTGSMSQSNALILFLKEQGVKIPVQVGSSLEGNTKTA